MESALKNHRETKINEDFEVSTALFSARFETRLFSKIDEIPEELVKLITDAVDSATVLDTKYLTTDTATRDVEYDDDYPYCACGCDSDYDPYDDAEKYVTGLAVDSYGFKDANTFHDVIVSTVEAYVKGRKRTVSYV